ncbi:MAG: hypothetical protein A2901_04795 [Elusimicrobia bacterium RIFCSPLOWO2_01_FULL_54_10]|nr:MAG: hypothetical protein A2901_04795 [Elusimicrobia bacterium RIFCSPLOWO2_01_FULL_54_10]
MLFKRKLNLNKISGSAFIFGPRMTGKTSLIKQLPASLFIDLLVPETELDLRQTPKIFWEQVSALPKGSLVVVDEIQKVPALLNYVQKGIEELDIRFILSGSSARKLKRGAANMLGGRALDLRLHPLTAVEMGDVFNLDQALQFGTLPKAAQLLMEKRTDEARQLLRSYYTIYIKEEVQAEALTRNVGAFQRFLLVAAQSNAQVMEFSNIARDCSVPMNTVKEYYSILEDTLLGEFLWPWDRSERKKARPKFYFFDNGVVRAMQNRLMDPPTPEDLGFLFECWMVRELTRLRDYAQKPLELSFWREGPHEIDILVMRGANPALGIECKSGKSPLKKGTVQAFQKRFPQVPLIVASHQDSSPRKLEMGIEVLPWRHAIDRFCSL